MILSIFQRSCSGSGLQQGMNERRPFSTNRGWVQQHWDPGLALQLLGSWHWEETYRIGHMHDPLSFSKAFLLPLHTKQWWLLCSKSLPSLAPWILPPGRHTSVLLPGPVHPHLLTWGSAVCTMCCLGTEQPFWDFRPARLWQGSVAVLSKPWGILLIFLLFAGAAHSSAPSQHCQQTECKDLHSRNGCSTFRDQVSGIIAMMGICCWPPLRTQRSCCRDSLHPTASQMPCWKTRCKITAVHLSAV